MGFTERQVLFLREMGLAVVPRAGSDDAGHEDTGSAAEVAIVTAKEPAAEASLAAPVRPLAPADNRVPVARAAVVANPRPAALGGVDVAGLEWAELREAVVACTACKLCTSGRRQTVFGVGHVQARWMVVGEAPGEQEDREGEPFVGKSGQLLDNMLRAIGVSRSETAAPGARCYIANTLKCRPPGNRNPEPEELARCEPFLLRQVELVRPGIILAMGRFAVQSLLRSDEPVGRLRGKVHRYHGVPLIVTYHPAYLLRNLEDKARAWEDLCLAAQVFEREGERGLVGT